VQPHPLPALTPVTTRLDVKARRAHIFSAAALQIGRLARRARPRIPHHGPQINELDH